MDRGVLLVLLCLQAFLLITAFTSTDAAALVKDDQQQQQQSIDQVKRFRLPKNPAEKVVLKKRQCAEKIGGCGFLVKRFRLPKNPAEEVVLKTVDCRRRINGCIGLVKRGTPQQIAGKKGQKRKGEYIRPGGFPVLDQ